MKSELLQKQTDIDYKLLVMYVLDVVGEISQKELNQIIQNEGLASYIPIALSLDDLLNTGEIKKEGYFYSLTKRGWDTLNLFENRIPNSIRTKLGLNAPTYRTEILNERNNAVWFSFINDNETQISMYFQQFNLMQMELKYTCLRENTPYDIGNKFSQNAETIYDLFLSIGISSDKNFVKDNNATYSVSIETKHKTQNFVLAKYILKNESWSAKILLPTVKMVETFAYQWEEMAQNVIEKIKVLLL